MARTLLLFIVLLPLWASAQEPLLRPEFRDEMWLSVSVRGRAPKFMKGLLGDHYKKLRFSGELGYRSADIFFAGRQLYTDLGARYKVTDWLSLGTEYRYASRAGRADRQRLGLQAYLSKTWNRFNLDYRFTFQRNYLERDRQRNLVRNRFSVEYNIRKWKLDPVFSVEFFTRIDDPGGWNHLGTRYKLGTSWSPWKGHSIGTAVLYDTDARVSWPTNRIIWSVDYTINLRRL